MLALFAMLLQEYAGIDESWKKHVSGVKHGKTRMQSVGFMLCQLSIVVHCCPLYPQGLCDPHFWTCRFFLHVFTRKDRPQISKFVHQGLRLNVGIMHTGSTFVLLRVSRMFVAPISFNILNLNYPLVN